MSLRERKTATKKIVKKPVKKVEEIDEELDLDEEIEEEKPKKVVKKKPVKKPVKKVEEEIDDVEEDEDLEEEIEEEKPKKVVKKKPVKKVEDDEDLEEDDDEVEDEKPSKKKSVKKTSKKSTKKVVNNKPTVLYIESKKPQYKNDLLPEVEEIEEETFVKSEDITKLLASRMNDILSISPVKTADNFIKEYNKILDELCQKHCEFTLLNNKKVRRVFVKARKYNVGEYPSLVASHFEMKMPVIFDNEYEECKIKLTEKDDELCIKNGKKYVPVDEEYLEKLDADFKKKHKKHFASLAKKSTTNNLKTATKKKATKVKSSTKTATKKKVVKKK